MKRFTIDIGAVDDALVRHGAVGVIAQAKRIGITREQWGKIRAGKVTTPRADTLDKIIRASRLDYEKVVINHLNCPT
ncbi:MAG: helix-turn-helix domain-containing protein [Stackebrandtia sp.]